MNVHTLKFIAAEHPPEKADIVLVGVPFDGTSTFRPGSRFGPHGVRVWSEVLETFSPDLGLDLDDLKLADLGDLAVPASGWEAAEAEIGKTISGLVSGGKIPVVLGGEHLITLPSVRACRMKFPDLLVLHLDAHLDLRDEYQGLAHSHATVMRRVFEEVGPGGLYQWGQRSGTREEWSLADELGTLVRDLDRLPKLVGDRPLYLTLDLDILDPSAMPDTGTPEPGGITFKELQELFSLLKGLPVAGADVVEFCPPAGLTGSSGAAAAKAVREIVLLCGIGRSRLAR